jgi:hypothetical protein
MTTAAGEQGSRRSGTHWCFECVARRYTSKMRPGPLASTIIDLAASLTRPTNERGWLSLRARGSSPIRKHAALADLPVDEMIPVADTVVV